MTKTGRLAVIVLLGAAAILGLAYAGGFGLSDVRHLGTPRNVLVVDGELVRVPVPEGPRTRVSPHVPVTTTGQYAFMFDDEDQGPARYDPCRTVDWMLNPAGMPTGAEALLHSAATQVGQVTGLQFRYRGETDEVALFGRPLIQERYGEQFAPIVVGWSDAATTPELAGSVTGVAGSTSVTGAYGNQRFLTSGVMILDREDIGELMGQRSQAAIATAVMMHEFAHVVGLGHVDDDAELMSAHNDAQTTWGPGDLAGLAIAGDGPCQ